jgi:hypothetical protein
LTVATDKLSFIISISNSGILPIMPFSLRASVAAAAGFLVLQARAEFDDLATLRSRGVGDYQVIGCGDDELLKSFRKVASFREDVPYAEVCGSICHEKYVGTRKG